MKRIISVLLIICISLCPFYVSAEETAVSDKKVFLLETVGISTSDMISNSEEMLTRADLAHIYANLFDIQLDAADKSFSDVEAGTLNAAEINRIVSDGLLTAGDDKFEPKNAADLETLCEIFLTYIGYKVVKEQSGCTYAKLAFDLGWINHISENISNGNTVSFIYNAMTKPYKDLNYASKLDYGTNEKTLLFERYKTEMYKVKIADVNKNEISAAVMGRVLADENGSNYKNGGKYTINLAEGIDAEDYKYAECFICVNDEEITGIRLTASSEIFNTYIYEVNENDEQIKVNPKYIKNIRLYDTNKYDVSSDFVVEYNGNEIKSPIVFADKFARVVVNNEEVVSVQIWDVNPVGLITDILNGKLYFVNAGGNEFNMKVLGEYDDFYVYIDGEKASFSQIKKNSVFSAYTDEKKCILAVSEKAVTDTLNSFSDDEIQIGRAYYNLAKIKIPVKDTEYKCYDSLNEFIGSNVTAYMDGMGICRYIIVNEKANDNVFFGLVVKSAREQKEDTEYLKILSVEGDSEEKVYKVSDKVRLYDENGNSGTWQYSEIGENAEKKDGSAVYIFTLNSYGTIIKIKKPMNYLGADKNSIDISQFTDSSENRITYNSRSVVLNKIPVYILREKDEKYYFEKSIGGIRSKRSSTSLKLSFYSDTNPNILEKTILTGDLSNIHNIWEEYHIGIVTAIRGIYNSEDDETQYSVTVQRKGNRQEYTLTKNDVKGLKENMWVRFYEGYAYKDGSSVKPDVENGIDLSEPFNTWESTTSLKNGIVKAIYNDCIILEDGSEYGYVYYLTSDGADVVKVTRGSSKNVFSFADISDIYEGCKINYQVTDDTVTTIFFEG